MFVSCLTGIWLWWPIGGGFRRGFRWKRQNSTNANIHHQIGFWILLPLAMLSFTGVWIAFPAFGRRPAAPARRRRSRSPQTRLTPDAALAAAQPLAPAMPVSPAITWPTDQSRRVEARLRAGRRDRGQRRDRRGRRRRSAPAAPQRPLARRWHDGTGMGPVWQTIIFLGGIIPAILSSPASSCGGAAAAGARSWRKGAKARRRRAAEAARRSRGGGEPSDRPHFFAKRSRTFRRWLAAQSRHARRSCSSASGRRRPAGPRSIGPKRATGALLRLDRRRPQIAWATRATRSASRRGARAASGRKVNVARYEALSAEGQMMPAGVRAYEENKGRSGVYSYENEAKALTGAEAAAFRKNKAAWADWEARPPGYRKRAPLGHQREEARNPRPPPRHPDRGQRRRPKDRRGRDRSEELALRQNQRQAAFGPQRHHARHMDLAARHRREGPAAQPMSEHGQRLDLWRSGRRRTGAGRRRRGYIGSDGAPPSPRAASGPRRKRRDRPTARGGGAAARARSRRCRRARRHDRRAGRRQRAWRSKRGTGG